MVIGGGDGVVDLLGEGVGVASGEAGCGDGVADEDAQRARLQGVGVHRKELIGADERDGDDGDLGAESHPCGAGLHIVEMTVGSAATFGEEHEREAGFERGDSAEKAGDGAAGVGGIDRDLAGVVEIPADEGNLPERLLGEDAELEGELGEEHRRIHIAEVVGDVDGGGMVAEFIGALDGDSGDGDPEDGACPGAGDDVLAAARGVPKTDDERDAAEGGGGQADEWEENDCGEQAERCGWFVYGRLGLG